MTAMTPARRYAERLLELLSDRLGTRDVPHASAVLAVAERAFDAVLRSRVGAAEMDTVRGPWCVVDTDNFGGDHPNEQWIAVGIRDRATADFLAQSLNDKSGPDGLRYYRVVPPDYVLVPGFEP